MLDYRYMIFTQFDIKHGNSVTLKTKSCHYANIVVTGNSVDRYNDIFPCYRT